MPKQETHPAKQLRKVSLSDSKDIGLGASQKVVVVHKEALWVVPVLSTCPVGSSGISPGTLVGRERSCVRKFTFLAGSAERMSLVTFELRPRLIPAHVSP